MIGNAEDLAAKMLTMPAFNFAKAANEYADKKSSESLSVSQFSRNVNSKKDLIYALSVKGKSKSLSLTTKSVMCQARYSYLSPAT